MDDKSNQPRRIVVEITAMQKRDGSDVLLNERTGTHHHVLATLTETADPDTFLKPQPIRKRKIQSLDAEDQDEPKFRVVWAIQKKIQGRIQLVFVEVPPPRSSGAKKES